MPTYEYGCSECRHEWEEIQRITAPATEVCPKCGKTSAHRLISPGTNFILKGGGWYSDLYASSNASKKKSDESSTSSTSTASPSSSASGKADSARTDTPAATPATPSASSSEKAA